jgi:hypothetical protein
VDVIGNELSTKWEVNDKNDMEFGISHGDLYGNICVF